MNKFIHVGCMFPSVPKTFQIDQQLAAAGLDWIRYASNSWVIHTDKPTSMIASLIRPSLTSDDQFLVVELSVASRAGTMAPWVWQWIDNRSMGSLQSLSEMLGTAGPYFGSLSPDPSNLFGLSGALGNTTPNTLSALAALGEYYKNEKK